MSALSATSPRASSMQLAHLQGHRAGELVHARAQDSGGFRDHGRSLANVVRRQVSKQVAAVLSAVSSCLSVSCSNVFRVLPS